MPDRYSDADPTDLDVPDREWSAAQARALAIVNCGLCDDDGYCGSRVCSHVDHRPAAQRGMAQIRAQMGWTQPTTHGRQ